MIVTLVGWTGGGGLAGKVRELVNDVVKSKRDAEREALDARAKLKMWEDKRSKAKALLHVCRWKCVIAFLEPHPSYKRVYYVVMTSM